MKNVNLTLSIPIAQLSAIWKGEMDRLPANETFQLLIDYPFGGSREHYFKIKTGKNGLGLIGLLGKIGKAYEKIHERPEESGVFGHDIDDLRLEGVSVNFKTKVITLDVGS